MSINAVNLLKKEEIKISSTSSSSLLRTSLILLMLILAVASVLFFSDQPAFANPCNNNPCPVAETQPIAAGSANTIFFRDTNSLDNSTATASLDKSTYLIGQIATLTINDFNENLDPNAIDIITAQVNQVGLVVLTETGTDTGIFQGSFVVSNPSISISYTPQPATGRLKAELDDVTTSGTAQMSDFIINDPSFAVNNCFTPVVQPVNFTIADAIIGPTGYTVTMSYANALLEPPVPAQDTQLLQMYYQPAGQGWTLVTFNAFGDPGANDPNAMTITSDPAFFGNPPITGSGLFTLGFDTGCGGGGGGGIVSAGLVLDLLAAAGASESNHVSPPSFGGSTPYHYPDGLTVTEGNQKTIFDTSKYNQQVPTQIMVSGQKVNMTFKTYEGYNPAGVIHMGLYIIPTGQDMITSNSIGSIVYDKNSPVEINDPNHILSSVSESSNVVGKFQYFQFSFVPTKSYDKMSFLARAWNDHMESTDIRVHDAVVPVAAPPARIPNWMQVFSNVKDADYAVESAGYLKPELFAHISTSDQVWSGSTGGNVLWFFDTKDNEVAVLTYDAQGNMLNEKGEKLVKAPDVPTGQLSSYSGNHLDRQNVDQLNNAKANQELVALQMMERLGYPIYFTR